MFLPSESIVSGSVYGAGPLMAVKTMLNSIAQRLRESTVHPTVGAGEHHYQPFRGLVGRSLRHVAVLVEHWTAFFGWHPGAFKLKARDGWIRWLNHVARPVCFPDAPQRVRAAAGGSTPVDCCRRESDQPPPGGPGWVNVPLICSDMDPLNFIQ